MLICFVQWEGPTDERNLPVVEEFFSFMGGAIGGEGNLGTSAEVDSPQQ
jgi:hypothetical protein